MHNDTRNEYKILVGKSGERTPLLGRRIWPSFEFVALLLCRLEDNIKVDLK
jgi:hypothetical protein